MQTADPPVTWTQREHICTARAHWDRIMNDGANRFTTMNKKTKSNAATIKSSSDPCTSSSSDTSSRASSPLGDHASTSSAVDRTEDKTPVGDGTESFCEDDDDYEDEDYDEDEEDKATNASSKSSSADQQRQRRIKRSKALKDAATKSKSSVDVPTAPPTDSRQSPSTSAATTVSSTQPIDANDRLTEKFGGTPWVNPQSTRYQPGVTGLHNEILDFCQWIAPQRHEFEVRWQVYLRVKTACELTFANNHVHVDYFGSFRTAIFLPTSDIDVVVHGKWGVDDHPLTELADNLSDVYNFCEKDSIQVLDKAAVPIIKVVDRITNIRVDISFNMDYGVSTATLVNEYLLVYPCLRYLLYVLKQFLLQRNLNEVYHGGISSYALTLMIVSFIQHTMDPVSAGAIPSPETSTNLGVLLINFLQLYGRDFNYMGVTIVVGLPNDAHGGAYGRKINDILNGPTTLSIIDPLQTNNDVGRSSYGVLRVQKAFKFAYDTLSSSVLYAVQDGLGHLSRIIRITDSVIDYRMGLYHLTQQLYIEEQTRLQQQQARQQQQQQQEPQLAACGDAPMTTDAAPSQASHYDHMMTMGYTNAQLQRQQEMEQRRQQEQQQRQHHRSASGKWPRGQVPSTRGGGAFGMGPLLPHEEFCEAAMVAHQEQLIALDCAQRSQADYHRMRYEMKHELHQQPQQQQLSPDEQQMYSQMPMAMLQVNSTMECEEEVQLRQQQQQMMYSPYMTINGGEQQRQLCEVDAVNHVSASTSPVVLGDMPVGANVVHTMPVEELVHYPPPNLTQRVTTWVDQQVPTGDILIVSTETPTADAPEQQRHSPVASTTSQQSPASYAAVASKSVGGGTAPSITSSLEGDMISEFCLSKEMTTKTSVSDSQSAACSLSLVTSEPLSLAQSNISLTAKPPTYSSVLQQNKRTQTPEEGKPSRRQSDAAAFIRTRSGPSSVDDGSVRRSSLLPSTSGVSDDASTAAAVNSTTDSCATSQASATRTYSCVSCAISVDTHARCSSVAKSAVSVTVAAQPSGAAAMVSQTTQTQRAAQRSSSMSNAPSTLSVMTTLGVSPSSAATVASVSNDECRPSVNVSTASSTTSAATSAVRRRHQQFVNGKKSGGGTRSGSTSSNGSSVAQMKAGKRSNKNYGMIRRIPYNRSFGAAGSSGGSTASGPREFRRKRTVISANTAVQPPTTPQRAARYLPPTVGGGAECDNWRENMRGPTASPDPDDQG